jgi:phosphoglycerate kinase
MKDFLTLDDVDVKFKTVLLRVDINVPYDEKTKQISESDRLIEHAKTIKELSEKRAKVIILAHQGRRGDPDFIHLNQHAEFLTKHVGKKVEFVEDVIGRYATEKIKFLRPGNLLLLDNVRFLDEETQEKTPEEHSRGKLVQTLASLADIFVNDAFSAAHRSHASLVGFTQALPSYAGRVIEREYEACKKALKPQHPNIFILGGAKPDDCLKIMNHAFEKKNFDKALTCGVLGELFLSAKGYMHGKGTANFLAEKGFYDFVPKVKEILDKYEDRIETPIDIAFESGGRKEILIEELPIEEQVLDIGRKTVEKYYKFIEKAKTIVMKGPAGVYEKQGFGLGTQSILEAVGKSKGFALVGGGDTLVAMEKLKVDKTKFNHVSLAGGALITFLSGEPMPAIEALKPKVS